jgi:hypothetical protein
VRPVYDEWVIDNEEMDLSELDWDWRVAFGLADEERCGHRPERSFGSRRQRVPPPTTAASVADEPFG